MLVRRPSLWILCALLLTAVGSAPAAAADLTGKWTWTARVGDTEHRRVAEFKQTGEKLTGAVTGNNVPRVEIQEGSVKGDQVDFVMVRERDGRQFRIRYSGKLTGETIKGKIVISLDGEERTFDWEAKRLKAAQVAGKWTSTITTQDGDQVTLEFELAQDGEKLTGTVTRPNGNKHELKEGKVEGDELSFQVLADRDGRELHVRFSGKLTGETLKGKITVTVGDQERELEWEAKRAVQ